MNHFNFKSLTFYGVAIGSVLLLFNTVTAYGEVNLKAPKPISGRYTITFAQNLLNCSQTNALVLTIEQSGIYLNGFLLPTSTNSLVARAGEKRPSLNGRLQDQQLSLVGAVPSSIFCVPNAGSDRTTNNVLTKIELQSQVEDKKLVGQITIDNIPGKFEFTGQKEAPTQPAENSSGHS